MACTITMNIGDRMTVTLSGDRPIEVVETASEFGEMPTKCVCGSANLSFKTRRPQDKYTYYTMNCGDCGREFQLGETKDKRLYPKYKEGWKTYKELMDSRQAVSDASGLPTRPASATQAGSVASGDDIPF